MAWWWPMARLSPTGDGSWCGDHQCGPGRLFFCKTTSTNYDSMWATLFNQDGIIVWNSKSAESTGLNLSDMMPDPDRLEELRSLMAQGNCFFRQRYPLRKEKIFPAFLTHFRPGTRLGGL